MLTINTEEDKRFHLEGVTRILDNVSHFSSSGGLGEATAWLCLREEIYISLLTQTAIRSSVAMFEHASWIQGDGDAAWGNRMVLLLAELLTHAFVEPPDPVATEDMKAKISDWHLLKPESLRPIHYLARNPSAGCYLPQIWMLASFQAVALQYYHIAQLVLAISIRTPSANFLEYSRNHQAIQQQVRHHLLHVVGIACSNVRAQNTWFTAHHCLAVWGGCLQKHGDQQACLDFLNHMEEVVGWRVKRLTEKLQSQWGDDGE